MGQPVLEMPQSTPPPAPASPEPWVDMKTLAAHLGFGLTVTVQKVREWGIPGHPFRCGKKTYWRFKLSEVDAYLQGRKP